MSNASQPPARNGNGRGRVRHGDARDPVQKNLLSRRRAAVLKTAQSALVNAPPSRFSGRREDHRRGQGLFLAASAALNEARRDKPWAAAGARICRRTVFSR
jgi:hypothetical protein